MVPFGRLKWTSFEVSFNWSATFGAKLGGIRELKTAIQTSFCHSCSPSLSYALGSDSLLRSHRKHSGETSQLAHKWASLYHAPITKSASIKRSLQYNGLNV